MNSFREEERQRWQFQLVDDVSRCIINDVFAFFAVCCQWGKSLDVIKSPSVYRGREKKSDARFLRQMIYFFVCSIFFGTRLFCTEPARLLAARERFRRFCQDGPPVF